ncbi:hypothetical protein EC991_008708 [Linnemannia zychae]|nr:hypothetical protein EC991_008708 [Linnemannia zychae]
MDNMSTTLIHKYHTLKAKKSTKRLASQDIFSCSPPSPASPSPTSTTTVAAVLPYSSFINDLVSAFNSLSTPSASSTTSPTLHTFFQGVDHEALVDTREKKKVVKALQLANPAQVNEIIAFLKAMPDPSKAAAAAAAAVAQDSEVKKSHSRDSSQQSLLSLVQDKGLKKKDSTVKKQKTDKKRAQNQEQDKATRLEDEKLGDDWDKVEKKWAWETQKSNDQLTGVVDPESCKNAAESILATAGSWFFSSPPDPARPPSPVSVPEKQKTLKSKPPKISTAVTNKDATNAKTTGFGSLWVTTTLTTMKSPIEPSPRNKKTLQGSTTKLTASATKLSTGEQIAQAAATLLAIAAKSSPKELPNTGAKQIRHQSSMPNIKTATLKRLLPTTKAGTITTTTPESTTKADSVALTPAPSYISTTLSSLTKQWLIPTYQTTPPPTNMMSAFTYWWGYEIYVPHKCMDTIERVSNTSQMFFGFLIGTVGTIPGLAALVPIAKIISAWVGYQWTVIKTQDTGRGVVISATWVLPVALASRPWDNCGHESDSFLDFSSLTSSPKKTLKSKLLMKS